MPADRTPGQRLGGRYAMGGQVGRGGFGVGWRAHDTPLQRDVAVKAIEFPPILEGPRAQHGVRLLTFG